MQKEIVTSLIGASTALIPLLINYVSKLNKESTRKNLLEESQSQIGFINTYYDSLHRFLPEAEMEALKTALAAELYAIKNKINTTAEKHVAANTGVHFTFQKIFLTYKPLSFMGWLWAILFYLAMAILFIVLLGSAITDQGTFSAVQFYEKVFHDGGTQTAIIILVIVILLFRWLAIRNYKKHSRLVPAN